MNKIESLKPTIDPDTWREYDRALTDFMQTLRERKLYVSQLSAVIRLKEAIIDSANPSSEGQNVLVDTCLEMCKKENVPEELIQKVQDFANEWGPRLFSKT